MSILDQVVVYRVWLGTYTEPVIIVALAASSFDDIAAAAKVALNERLQEGVRPEFEESDSVYLTDRAADAEVAKIERGPVGWLVPTLSGLPREMS